MKIAVVSDNYSKNEKALFLQDIEDLKSELFIRLWQRKSQFTFIPIFTPNKNYKCTESSMFDGSTCDEQMVEKAIGNTPHDVKMVAAKKLTGGGGGGVCIWGTSLHDALHAGQTGTHEIYHTMTGDPNHTGGFMSESGGHGSAGESATFTPSQFEKINTVLNRFATIASPNPTIQITGTQVLTTSVRVNAKATGLIEHVDFTVDGIKTTYMYWERNQNFNQNGITAFTNPLSSGTHKIELTVFDVNNLSATVVTSVTI